MQNELADQSVLYIFADGPKDNITEEQLEKMTKVRQLIRAKQWCKQVHIIESAKNKGLAGSVIDGVTQIVNEYGKIIVLEDDLITSSGFLKYMNLALEKFKDEEKVFQISGYIHPLKKIKKAHSSFFLSMVTSWGWATWQSSWAKFDPFAEGYQKLKSDPMLAKQFDLNGSCPYTLLMLQQMEDRTIDSWAIRWWWCVFINDGVTLFPDQTLVKNIGYGSQGTHTKGKDKYPAAGLNKKYRIENFPDEVTVNSFVTLQVQQYLSGIHNWPFKKSKFIRSIEKLKRLLS